MDLPPSARPKYKTLAVMLAVVVVGASVLVRYIGTVFKDVAEIVESPPMASASPSVEAAVAPSPASSAASVQSKAVAPASWSPELLAQFGPASAYQVQAVPGGKLGSVRARLEELGKLRKAADSSSGYDSKDAKRVQARAREVLQAFQGALGVPALSPLENGPVRSDAQGGQAVFQQTVDGAPVMPGGTFTVDLGPNGELLGAYNDVRGITELSGAYRISPEEGALRAAQGDGGQRPAGGTRVVFVRTDGQARRALEYFSQGRQVIVDAENGEVLFRRDRRVF